MKAIKFFIIPLLSLFSFAVQAQEQQIWSLEQCINHAIENNLKIKHLELSQKGSEIQLREAKNEWLPSAGISIGHNYDFGRAPKNDGSTISNNSSSTNLSAQISLPIFSGFSTQNRIRASKEELEAAFENLNKAKEDLSLNITALYINILLQKEVLNSCEIQMELTLDQTKRIRHLLESGKVSKNKLFEMESELAKDEMIVTEAENTYALARLDLIQALELDINPEEFNIITPDITQINPQEKLLFSTKEVYNNTLNNRPAIKAQEHLINSSKYALKIAQSGYYPMLSFGANYGNGYYSYFGKNHVIETPSFATQMNQNNRYTFGVSLQIPLFDRFTTTNATKKATLNIKNNELTLEEIKKSIYKEIQQAIYNVEAAQKKFSSTIKALESAQIAFEFASISFENDRLTTYELNQAKVNFAMSRLQQIQSLYDFLLKKEILNFYNKNSNTE